MIRRIANDLRCSERDLLRATLQTLVAAPFVLAGLWAVIVLLIVSVPA